MEKLNAFYLPFFFSYKCSWKNLSKHNSCSSSTKITYTINTYSLNLIELLMVSWVLTLLPFPNPIGEKQNNFNVNNKHQIYNNFKGKNATSQESTSFPQMKCRKSTFKSQKSGESQVRSINKGYHHNIPL